MSQIVSHAAWLVLASMVRGGWTWVIYPLGIVLFLLAVSVLIPMEMGLASRDDAVRERVRSRFIRAGCVACLLAHLAVAGVLYRGWQELNILGPRLTRRDIAFVFLLPSEQAAAGWWALAWTLLLVRLYSSRAWRWRPALVLIEVALAALVMLLLTWDSGVHGIPATSTPNQSAGEQFVPEVAHIHPPPPFDLSPGSLIPFAWLFVPLGLATALAALRDWRLARRSALELEQERARRDLALSGLFVLAVSIVWLLGVLAGPLSLLVVQGPLAPPTADLQRDFLAAAWIPGLAALAGLLALCFGAVHRRRREEPTDRA